MPSDIPLPRSSWSRTQSVTAPPSSRTGVIRAGLMYRIWSGVPASASAWSRYQKAEPQTPRWREVMAERPVHVRGVVDCGSPGAGLYGVRRRSRTAT